MVIEKIKQSVFHGPLKIS